MSLSITKINVHVIKNPTNKIKAYADVTLNDTVCVKTVKVCDGKDGLFVAMPNYLKNGDGKRRRIVYFIGEFATTVEERVLAVYQSRVEEAALCTA